MPVSMSAILMCSPANEGLPPQTAGPPTSGTPWTLSGFTMSTGCTATTLGTDSSASALLAAMRTLMPL